MTLLSRNYGEAKPIVGAEPLDLAVADAGWYTTDHLFRECRGNGVRTILLECLDVRQARSRWGSWRSAPRVQETPTLSRRQLSLPPGWLNRWPRLGMRPIAATVRSWRRSLDRPAPLALVITYPHYLTLADLIEPDLLIYFNVDDYRLYWPNEASSVAELEAEAVRRADLCCFVSDFRAREARALHPERAGRILHVPHGAPDHWLSVQDAPAEPPPELKPLPHPWIGYVGTMEDRVDWELVRRVSDAFPSASLILVGNPDDSGDQDWQRKRRAAFARPNVHRMGLRSQAEVARFNRSFDVGLIPYRTDHPFNLASCPTKIMDYLACGLPAVSTALPECRLHSDRLRVAESPQEFLAQLSGLLEFGTDANVRESNRTFARGNACSRVAARLMEEIRSL